MSLKPEQIGTSKLETEHCFGVPADLRLFGTCGEENQRGFSLIELITVIVLVGIISVVALPRFAGNDAFRDRAAADQVTAALRYGQKVAIASHSTVTVNISTGNPASCGTEVVAGVINCVVSDSVIVSGTPSVVFDFMGRPGAAGSVEVGATPVTTVTIEAETGYVH